MFWVYQTSSQNMAHFPLPLEHRVILISNFLYSDTYKKYLIFINGFEG